MSEVEPIFGFPNDGGLRGVLYRRDDSNDEEKHTRVVSALYAFEVEDGIFVLSTSTTIVSGINNYLRDFASLAATVRDRRIRG